MSTKHTISINGQIYDATTGLPVAAQKQTSTSDAALAQTKEAVAKQPHHVEVHREPTRPSHSIHRHTQKSMTLKRGHLAAPKSQTSTSAQKRREPGRVARSQMISHFASHPKPLPKHPHVRMINDIGPVARQAITTPSTRERLPSREVKERLLATAGAAIDRKLVAEPAKRSKTNRVPFLKRLKRRHLATAGAAALLLFGYVAYLNMPSLSVRIAAMQSGVHAKYPDYNPDGYSFAGPVAYQPGEVEIRFKSNGGGEGYTIREKNSDWNSVAVLDNLVSKSSGKDYEVSSTSGITIYTYGTNAAWTNGGVLYTIDSKAPLSNDQLLRIAASM